MDPAQVILVNVLVSKTYREPIHTLNVAGHTVEIAGELHPLKNADRILTAVDAKK